MMEFAPIRSRRHRLSPRPCFFSLLLALGVSLAVMSAWAEPATGPAVMSVQERQLQQLVDELGAAIRAAEENGRADPVFLGELRQITERYSWPWRAPVLQDSFADGDYSRDPAWTIAAGDFWVDTRSGLQTEVEVSHGGADQAPTQPTTPQPGGETNFATPDHAEIYINRDFSNGFALAMRFSSRSQSGQFLVGPYQGADRDQGYRLVYHPDGGNQGLELVKLRPDGAAVVAAAEEAVDLDDGNLHEIVWTRAADGTMRVSVDGRPVIEATDRDIAGDWLGLTLVNRGGDYALHELRVDALRPG